MRDIIFRGKSVTTGNWVYGDLYTRGQCAIYSNGEWVVKRVITYPSVNHGEPVIEIEKDNNWMRLSADMFYSKEYAEYLEKKYKEKNESN